MNSLSSRNVSWFMAKSGVGRRAHHRLSKLKFALESKIAAAAYSPEQRYEWVGNVIPRVESVLFLRCFSHSAFMAIKGDLLAKPNYQFEKRQKEIAKKNKKEEKRRQKSEGNATADDSSQKDLAIPSAATPSDIC